MIEKSEKKIITCILSKGAAIDVIRKLKEDKGIITSNVQSARGMGKLTPMAYRGVGEQTEKEILTIAVETDIADEIFEYIYAVAEIDRPHGGIIFIAKLQHASTYTLPDIPEEE